MVIISQVAPLSETAFPHLTNRSILPYLINGYSASLSAVGVEKKWNNHERDEKEK